MVTARRDFFVVLIGRVIGADVRVAEALSRLFHRDKAWGLQVISSSPVILLMNLSEGQAWAVHEALREVELAGSKLEVQTQVSEEYAVLRWPEPPRINGKLVSEFQGFSSVAPPKGKRPPGWTRELPE